MSIIQSSYTVSNALCNTCTIKSKTNQVVILETSRSKASLAQINLIKSASSSFLTVYEAEDPQQGNGRCQPAPPIHQVSPGPLGAGLGTARKVTQRLPNPVQHRLPPSPARVSAAASRSHIRPRGGARRTAAAWLERPRATEHLPRLTRRIRESETTFDPGHLRVARLVPDSHSTAAEARGRLNKCKQTTTK